MDGFSELPPVDDNFLFADQELPPLADFTKYTSWFPGVLSLHATYTLAPCTAMDGDRESPAFAVNLVAGVHVIPPSGDFLKKIS
jgi:hypothetical protein